MRLVLARFAIFIHRPAAVNGPILSASVRKRGALFERPVCLVSSIKLHCGNYWVALVQNPMP